MYAKIRVKIKHKNLNHSLIKIFVIKKKAPDRLCDHIQNRFALGHCNEGLFKYLKFEFSASNIDHGP